MDGDAERIRAGRVRVAFDPAGAAIYWTACRTRLRDAPVWILPPEPRLEVDDLSFEAFMRDPGNVVDANGLDRFPLLGISQSISVA